jgi:hypothetical protein
LVSHICALSGLRLIRGAVEREGTAQQAQLWAQQQRATDSVLSHNRLCVVLSFGSATADVGLCHELSGGLSNRLRIRRHTPLQILPA